MIFYIWFLFTVNCVFCMYYNYTLYDITAFNPRERKFLYSIYTKEDKIIFMNDISNEAAIPIHVAVVENSQNQFESKLNSLHIKYAYFPEYCISLEMMKEEQKIIKKDISKAFYNWNSILNWITAQEKKYNIFQKIVIAKTSERRDIILIKISNGANKPIVFVVGGEDGKDWMSSAIILNFANQLLKTSDGENKLLKEFNFYLLPVLNPDGFVYSKTNVGKQDRFWSKNRRIILPPVQCINNNTAVGVNIARNWFLHETIKVPYEECKGVYIGNKPLSEEETQALSYVLNSIATKMISFITVKGFGKFITIPYSNKEPTNNHDILVDILTSASTTLKNKFNVTYYVGTTNTFIYNLTGSMADWVKRKLNIPIVFTMYLYEQTNLLPKSDNILSLLQHFHTVLNETLVIFKDIYGPLYQK